jgi:NitT/TauT family transport system substrate-binding protein
MMRHVANAVSRRNNAPRRLLSRIPLPPAEPGRKLARPAEFTTSELLFRAFLVAIRGGILFAHQGVGKEVLGACNGARDRAWRKGNGVSFGPQWQRYLRAALILVAALTGPPSAASAQTALKLSLDTRLEGPTAPFLVGLDKGYYRAENLDVAIDAGANALEPITRVAAGAYDMGFADINTLIRYRDQNPSGVPKAVFIVYNRAPYAVIARKSRGIATPKDLEGKKLGAPATDPAFAVWKTFAQANGIDASKVGIENVGFPVREPMLAAGQLDAITGLSFSSFVNLKDRGVPADDILVLRMAEHGVDLYGNAIIVNPKFAAEKPEAVRAFLRAFLKGLKETLRDPSHAVDSVVRRNDLTKKDVELERLRMALRENIVTPEVREHGLGGIDAGRLDRSIDEIALSYEFKAKPKAADIFDPVFLSEEGERRLR